MLQAMKEDGWRITGQRKCLAQLFASTDDYLSPTEVYEALSQSYPGISYDTVYRNLRNLHELGALEQFYFEDGVKFKGCCAERHHHHAICMNCKKTFSIEYCPMDQLPHLPQSFQVVNHKFEVFGYCEACSENR